MATITNFGLCFTRLRAIPGFLWSEQIPALFDLRVNGSVSHAVSARCVALSGICVEVLLTGFIGRFAPVNGLIQGHAVSISRGSPPPERR